MAVISDKGGRGGSKGLQKDFIKGEKFRLGPEERVKVHVVSEERVKDTSSERTSRMTA